MPSEVVKTRSITHRATVELTEAQIAAYVIAGVKRDNPSVKDYDMVVEFAWDAHAATGGDDALTATVSGERIA